jgi:hypothetical protein
VIEMAPMQNPPDHPLKIWRLAQRPALSQAAVGSKLHTTGVSVGRWESGAMPDFGALILIEKLTGLTAADFHKHRVTLARRKQQESRRNGEQTETGGGSPKRRPSRKRTRR